MKNKENSAIGITIGSWGGQVGYVRDFQTGGPGLPPAWDNSHIERRPTLVRLY